MDARAELIAIVGGARVVVGVAVESGPRRMLAKAVHALIGSANVAVFTVAAGTHLIGRRVAGNGWVRVNGWIHDDNRESVEVRNRHRHSTGERSKDYTQRAKMT